MPNVKSEFFFILVQNNMLRIYNYGLTNKTAVGTSKRYFVEGKKTNLYHPSCGHLLKSKNREHYRGKR